ncbi:leucine--tRNA ligase [Candidatus Nomurabacteria bacterium]|nr:leucine--tRNA ligase [Candidatus Nomurabacteria bacterium]
MKRYSPSDVEPKWQKIWSGDSRYRAEKNTDKPKYYISGMFPYPSGAGMHTGHFFEHSIVDVVARFYRSQGFNVLYPMGWDAFGLPAENYAIKTGTAPADSTRQNIANFTNQLQRVGASIDWSREINTSSPEYYKWTQWVFTKFFERGLAYQKEANQWWCPIDKTVLANEQVEGGKCWRCGTEVEKKSMKQWFFKITDYADALLDEIPALDWPNKIKVAQENWIGKSQGAEIAFSVDGHDEDIKVFTTRPDTIFGATFMILAPEHPLVKKIATDETRSMVDDYVSNSIKKSEIERMSESKDKTGVFTGSYAINPATGDKVPVWVADYVLWGYGTGAIMAVPAHDERDLAFAEKYDLPVVSVIDSKKSKDGVIVNEGTLINSGQFDGTETFDAREQIVAWLEQQKVGEAKTTYKMRDWLISRQRYWGAPIPIIHCEKDGPVAVPESDLPVLLPEVEDYEPKGQSVLAGEKDWISTTCPKCGGAAERETDTMDGYACSSWYLLRYVDPKNQDEAWSSDLANYWTPIDMYVGGDHAVAHLLYVRFWSHVFYDMGLVPTKEPVKKLVYHGYINAEDGTKMSKSKGNVVDPIEIIDAGYGADALRTFELFLGPINENSQWNSRGIAGVYRFLNRVWNITQEFIDAGVGDSGEESVSLRSLQHSTVKKVTSDIYKLNFNTAIASLMEYVNALYKLKQDGFTEQWRGVIETLVLLVGPFAPHMAAELWRDLGHDDQLDFVAWPEWDDELIASETVTIVVQVNGKVRARLEVDKGIDENEAIELAKNEENVKKFLSGSDIKKTIYVPEKLINIVA